MLKLPAIRSSLVILAASASLTLIGVAVISFGGRYTGDHPIAAGMYAPSMILALGFAGVLMPFIKRIAGNRRLRLVLGIVSALPIFKLAVASAIHLSVSVYLFSFFAPAALFVVFAYWNEEPGYEAAEHHLVEYFAGTVLILLGFLMAVFPAGSHLPVPQLLSTVCVTVGAAGIYLNLRRPRTAAAEAATYLQAGVMVSVATAAYLGFGLLTPLIVLLPLALILGARRWTRLYRLGEREPEDLDEEVVVVHRFERIAEMVAWTVFLFTYVHQHFDKGSATSATLFWLFVAAFAVFTAQYRMRPWKGYSFEKFYRQSMINAFLLAVVAHLTGGLLSPYVWFFVFILISGAFSSKPRQILDRLAIVMAYFFAETLYAAGTGTLFSTIIVNQLLLQVFIIGLTGLYSYQLSVSRRQIDHGLIAMNQKLKDALAAEQRAKAVATLQSDEIVQAKERNEAIFASLGEAVVALDRDGYVVLANAAVEDIAGRSSDDLLGMRLRETLGFKKDDAPDFWIGNYIDSAMNGNAVPLPADVYVEREDGRRVYVEGTLIPTSSKDKETLGAVAVLRDVTYLREVDQLKSGFLSVAAHQLRTPLSTIRWYLELLNDPSEGKLNKNQKLFAENAYISLRRMVDLINSLLAVTRIESGRVPVKPVATDLRKLTESILTDLGPKILQKKITTHVKAEEGVPTVDLDPQLSREVFTNLVDNAIRYTPDGGSIVIGLYDEGDRLHWSIVDTGIGIPLEHQKRIFEKFYRAPNALSAAAEGTGLGLYLAKFIVGTWGGEIWFESSPQKGTTFHVSVPKSGMKAKAGTVSLNA